MSDALVTFSRHRAHRRASRAVAVRPLRAVRLGVHRRAARRRRCQPPRRSFWTPLRVILFTGLVFFAISWLQKYPCSGDWLDWQQYTYACYTDLRALWSVERLNEGAIPYRDHPVEYPVLTGWFMGVLGQIAYRIGNIAGTDGGTIFYHLNAVALFACGVAAIAVLYAIRTENRRTDLRGLGDIEPRRPNGPAAHGTR